jgi:formiminotetrahydrofolate cyclodeaminase
MGQTETRPKPSETIGEFAELVAAGTPTPGGGSVAAYCGLLATALGQMVCNLTIGKKKFAAVEPQVKQINSRLQALGVRFRELIDEDATSFEAVLEAYRMPKQTQEQLLARQQKIEAAVRHSIDVPYETACSAIESLVLLYELAKISNPNALSDLSLGAQLAQVAATGAYYNIRVNLAAISDKAKADQIRQQIVELVRESERYAGQIEEHLLERMKAY